MATSNEWLTPYQRSFNQIKGKLLNSLRSKVPEITDYTEGNIFIILISMFAAIAEVIHYYIDNMAREAFFPTARKYTSLYRHAKLVDYHIKCAIPATVDIYLSLEGGPNTDIYILENTQFQANDGSVWITYKTVTWPKGVPSVLIPLIQKEKSSSNISLGYITQRNASIYLPDLEDNQYYAEGTMKLTIGRDVWTLVDTFAYANSTDKVYKIEPDSQNRPRIIFGDGINGMQPDLNMPLIGEFWTTLGEGGNIAPNSFTTVPSISGLDEVPSIYQPNYGSGGSNYETFDMIKSHVPLSIKTLGVAITKEDFEAMARLVPGVNKAYCEYICGQVLNMIISPDYGIEANSALLDQVSQSLSKSKVITTSISVQSTHKTSIYLDADIYGKPSFSKSDITEEVIQTLLNTYNQNTSDIRQTINLSDIYALIDNINIVDHVNINKIYIRSYARASRVSVEGGYSLIPLDIDYFCQNKYVPEADLEEGKVDKIDVTIVIGNDTSTYTLITSDGYAQYNMSWGTVYNIVTDRVSFDISLGDVGYNPNVNYTFSLQPMNTNLTPLDYNIPVFESSTINLTVHESI